MSNCICPCIVLAGFEWLDGTATEFTNWRPNEPSLHGWGGNIENCMEVFLSDGKWNDEDCNRNRMFVCEKQIGKINIQKRVRTFCKNIILCYDVVVLICCMTII